MQIAELVDRIEASPDLEGVGFDDESVTICSRVSKLCTRVALEKVRVIEWEELEPILHGREPDALLHLARIVGYYSRVDNWNEAKLGELRDRHKGSYAVA